MSIVAKRFNGLASAAVPTTVGSVALPAGFVIPAGIYVFGGQTFDCTAEGYYVFWNPITDITARRIVYAGDVVKLMSSLSLGVAVGSQDNGLTVAQAVTQATTQKPRMLCGNTAIFAKALCDSLVNISLPAVTSRYIWTLTSQTPTNYFDGHAMLEAKVTGVWHLFDLALGIDFGGLAAKDAIPLQSPVVRGVTKEVVPGPVTAGGFDADAWLSDTMNDAGSFESEALRVLQIPGILWADGKIHCYLPAGMGAAAAYVTGLGWVVETQANWLAGSYP